MNNDSQYDKQNDSVKIILIDDRLSPSIYRDLGTCLTAIIIILVSRFIDNESFEFIGGIMFIFSLFWAYPNKNQYTPEDAISKINEITRPPPSKESDA